MPNTNELMSPSEAGMILDVSTDTIIRYANEKRIDGWQYCEGGDWHIRRASVLAFKANRTSETLDSHIDPT